MSGADSSSRHSATRRFSPPESVPMLRLPRRQPQRIGSDLELALELPAAGRRRWRPAACACRASSVFICSSSMGSREPVADRLNSSSWRKVSPSPSMTVVRTSLAASSCGSCGRKPMRMPLCGRASPSKLGSMPAMILSSEDLPEPFRPSTPILAPGKERQADVAQDDPLRRHHLGNAVHGVDVLGHASDYLRGRRRWRWPRHGWRRAPLC